MALEIFEDGLPPRFRLWADASQTLEARAIKIETVRACGAWQRFTMTARDGYHRFARNWSSSGQLIQAAMRGMGAAAYDASLQRENPRVAAQCREEERNSLEKSLYGAV